MRMDLVKRLAVEVSRVPSSALWRTRAASSEAERAEEISSWGSMPILCRTQLAAPLRTEMSGRKTFVNTIWKGTTMPAVFSGCARARFFGTSSPKSMEKALMKTAATMTAIVVARAWATPTLPSSAVRSFAIVVWVV